MKTIITAPVVTRCALALFACVISTNVLAGCKSGCYDASGGATCQNGKYLGNYTCTTPPAGVSFYCCYQCGNPDVITYCQPSPCPSPVYCTAALAPPNSSWSCTGTCQPVGSSTTLPTGQGNNTSACVYTGPQVCTQYVPPPGTTTTSCGGTKTCPDPTTTQTLSYWKGKCQYIASTECPQQTETTVTYMGVTYYTCTPDPSVYYYSCPGVSSSAAPASNSEVQTGSMGRGGMIDGSRELPASNGGMRGTLTPQNRTAPGIHPFGSGSGLNNQ